MVDGKIFPVKLLQELYGAGNNVEKVLFLSVCQEISS
jgi:hypothetical protein